MFTAEFWEKTVTKDGLAALRPPDHPGFAVWFDVPKLESEVMSGLSYASVAAGKKKKKP